MYNMFENKWIPGLVYFVICIEYGVNQFLVYPFFILLVNMLKMLRLHSPSYFPVVCRRLISVSNNVLKSIKGRLIFLTLLAIYVFILSFICLCYEAHIARLMTQNDIVSLLHMKYFVYLDNAIYYNIKKSSFYRIILSWKKLR